MDFIKNWISAESEGKRATWGSPAEYWLCVLGYAVGYGSLWRFPYLLFENGGGAFLIPYTICLFSFGIPLFYWESAIGQITQKGIIASYCSIDNRLKGFGIAAITVTFLCATYYNVLLAYSWIYFYYSFYSPLPWDGGISGASNTSSERDFFYNTVLQITGSMDELGGFNQGVFWAYILSQVLCYFCIANGVSTTGKIAYFTAGGPYVLILILMFRGFMLEGSSQGLLYIFTYDLKYVFDLQVWYKAAAQVLFQLSLVSGALTALASYRKKNESVLVPTFSICMITFLTGMLGALTVFSYAGYLSAKLKILVNELPLQGPDLLFITYPLATLAMPFSNIWAILFFFCMVLLGIDSQFVMLECASNYLEESDIKLFGSSIKPQFLRMVPTVGCFIIGLCTLTRAGFYYFSFMDEYCVGGPMLGLAVVECAVFAYHPTMRKLKPVIFEYTGEHIPAYFEGALKYFATPATILLYAYGSYELISGLFNKPPWAIILGIVFLFLPVGQIVYFYYEQSKIPHKIEDSDKSIELPIMHEHNPAESEPTKLFT